MNEKISKIIGILKKKPIKIILLAFCYLMLALSLIGAFLYVFLDFTILGIVIAIIAPSMSGFVVFWTIIPAIIIIRLQFWEKKKSAILVLSITAFIVLASYFPYYTVPATIINAEMEMTTSYGSTYTSLDTTNMEQMPYNIWYSFNPPTYDVNVTYDIPYVTTVWGDTILYDMYLPNNIFTKAANSTPVIVHIHGGGWTVGSKESANVQQRSKYFASKGYVVFDVSYGLYSVENLTANMNITGLDLSSMITLLRSIPISAEFIPTYNHDYTIPEQVDNLATFFVNLSTNIKSAIPQLNISQVFTMGGSAGGLLSSVISTGYNTTVWGDKFPDSITIIGGMHFYPPTDLQLMKAAVAEGKLGAFPAIQVVFDVWFDASGVVLGDLMRNHSSAYLVTLPTVKPKADLIILHGSKDNLVPYYRQAVIFKHTCAQYGTTATLITVYGAGHAFDLTYTSPGYQITMYYMERFAKIVVGAS